MKKTLYLIALASFSFLLLLHACSKTEDPINKLVLKEYPGMTPAAGASILLYRPAQDLSGYPEKIGVFTADAEGLVKTSEDLSWLDCRVIEGGDYIPTGLYNDALPIPEYYAAKPGWIRLNIRNVPPANTSDQCVINLLQMDPLGLPNNSFINLGSLNYIVQSYNGGSVNESSLYKLISGIPAKLDVHYGNGAGIDSTLQFMVPKNDTLIVNFDF